MGVFAVEADRLLSKKGVSSVRADGACYWRVLCRSNSLQLVNETIGFGISTRIDKLTLFTEYRRQPSKLTK